MNRNRFLIIGLVALVLAGTVSFLIYRFMQVTLANSNSNRMVTVVAAAENISLGAQLEEKNLRLVKMPAATLPPGTFHSTSEVVGRGVIIPMTQSELVLASKLAPENAGAGLPSLIPAGMRAVSVKVNDVISVAGFVTPGTRVDVVLTGSPERDALQDPGKITTTTVLENVQVLAAGQKLQKNDQGEPQQVTVITLLVNPNDAQKLVLAAQEGKIQLALRNPVDTDQEKIPILKNATLYRLQPGGAEPVIAKASHKDTHLAKAVAPSTPPPYIVEMIRGEKRDVSKF